jgi:DNA-binding CsgD family transcriptional regulator
VRLTKRQADVLRAVLEGLSDKEIACRHCISISCAKFHVQRLFRKYNVHDRRSLADKFGRFVVEVRWIPASRDKSRAEADPSKEPRRFPHRVRIND